MEQQEHEEQDEPEEPVAAPAAPQYLKGFHKKCGAWIARVKFWGRRQIFQVGSAQMSKQELEHIADAAILRLSSRQSEAAVKQWAKDQVGPAREKQSSECQIWLCNVGSNGIAEEAPCRNFGM
jgi:hypothetical protein